MEESTEYNEKVNTSRHKEEKEEKLGHRTPKQLAAFARARAMRIKRINEKKEAVKLEYFKKIMAQEESDKKKHEDEDNDRDEESDHDEAETSVKPVIKAGKPVKARKRPKKKRVIIQESESETESESESDSSIEYVISRKPRKTVKSKKTVSPQALYI